ncbi:nicotinamide N-methyltransferase-like [Homarus americanus]|uniref:nicotinamide N-methyltransferase-like n=1 Tax=Homarus americanus TaxID=6706 RepID=UPI001C464F30|nr:nicotinamide N-methyltransferase-like [Homarus americanus]
MCEILPKNREELQAWMEGGEEALDWTPFFTYLASLMPPRNGEEVAERLRDVFQLVLPCDLTQREPLSPIRQKYDVIMTTLCVEFTSWSTEDYQELVGRVVTLLKPGGVFF